MDVQANEIREAAVSVRHHPTFSVVHILVRDENRYGNEITFFCQSGADLDRIMAAMARAVRDYYADAEPEPDWEAIAAEYDELCRER